MEKSIFLAVFREKLTEMNLPQDTVENHVKIFEDCLKGKNDEETEKIIEGSGGIDGIIKSIYNLESTKKTITQADSEADSTHTDIQTASDEIVTDENITKTETDTEDEDLKIFVSPSAEFEALSESADNIPANDVTSVLDDDSNTPTVEIEIVDNIGRHIKEAEEITNTLEHLAVIPDGQTGQDAEYGDELSEYDFEKLFEEKLSRPEKWAKKLREKLPSKAFWATLPIALIIFGIFYLINIVLFPVLLISALICSVAYLCTLIAGICFALVPIGYGVYMCFKTLPIALYELGIGVTVLGITMFFSILLYNYVKRLTPFLFKQLKRLFKYNNKLAKRYFNKPIKEEL